MRVVFIAASQIGRLKEEMAKIRGSEVKMEKLVRISGF